ncbi:MAG: Isoleucine-tRNA ligase [candidate division WS6 bacterium GW2011_GWC1_36_11]|uniref:Isoleucine-tRNA ligase n=1 Tax=candidate division WS6 bacterium GW2011_GWC1_36_11 TaxID=1619090 RepID=A0A0G0DME5_9BACT|nr:MAG: Isoleucine-tRNA ligase [candidate division WS6 bacterium GW2011_GWC1_36_11]
MVEISKLLAPFAPFLAESAYQTLVSSKKESVHLEDFSVVDESKLDEELLTDMDNIRKICSLGLNIRDENRIKVRQPLAQAFIPVEDSELQEIVKGELNVKEAIYSKEAKEVDGFKSQSDGTVFVTLDTNISDELKAEGFLNELTRGLQVARKESGCQVGQDITVKYQTESKEIEELISSHLEELEKVVLAKSFEKVATLENGIKLKLAEVEVFVEIIK